MVSLSETRARGKSEAGGDTDCSLSGLSALIFTVEDANDDEAAAAAAV